MAHRRSVIVVQAKRSQPLIAASALLLGALVGLAASRPAHAYVDPNSAGQLYQFLFPFLIAAASMLAALRRYIARLWSRLMNAVVMAMRRERAGAPSDTER
jgi:hypothetical protein